VGCIHIGSAGERPDGASERFAPGVAYDFEPLFSLGAMLGITDPAAVTGLLEEVEVCGLDAISTGVTLAWATEALERGILSLRETVEELRFGDPRPYRRAVHRLTRRESGFYFALSRGAEHAARLYGGEEFACVLGQEMAGYATGEAFLAAQALGFRHSHLDSGGYRLDQEAGGRRDEAWVVEHLLRQERERVLLSCMVGCLFGRTAYPASTLATALQSLGYSFTEEELLGLGERIRARRWRLRLAGGFEPEQIRIPERFLRIRNWKGGVDSGYLERILARYAAAIRSLVRADEVRSLGSNGSL
jgi:aldehyde:ferredoxin oxidoreductase